MASASIGRLGSDRPFGGEVCVKMGPAKGQVPESVLKKRKRDEDWATKKAAAVSEQKKKSKGSRNEIFKRAEKYVKEYRDQVPSTILIASLHFYYGL